MGPDDDLRTALESAVEQVEKTETSPTESPVPAPPTEPPKPTEPVEEEPKEVPPSEGTTTAETVSKITSAPKPINEATDQPKSWKASLASKWSKLDPEVKAEIHRRERDFGKVFGENNQVREFHKQFQDVVRPYEARLMTFGSPLQAIANLLQAEYLLSSSPPVQRAQLMAKYIKDYGIDIRELDAALAGEQPTDPVAAHLERLLEQKLSPLQQFIAQQQQIARSQEQQLQVDASNTIEEMAADYTKYPHFEEVREDMADIIELNAKRNVYLTPSQAYDRAVAMNPAWVAERVQAQQNETQRQAAVVSNDRANRALQASSSVKSVPSSSPVNVAVNESEELRSTIEAAFNQVHGR